MPLDFDAGLSCHDEKNTARSDIEGEARECAAADPSLWHEIRNTDFWKPPQTAQQHRLQRALALLLAFVLAVAVAELGS